MRVNLVCVIVLIAASPFSFAQIAIIDSGSTNFPGLTVKLKKSGPQAVIEPASGAQQTITLDQTLCARLKKDLKAAGPLNELPANHCMKSVSFGASLFIEQEGVRSPDLSCRQTDSRAASLKQDASDILSAAKLHVPHRQERLAPR